LGGHLTIALLPVGKTILVQLRFQAVNECVRPGSEAKGGLAIKTSVLKMENRSRFVATQFPSDDGVFSRLQFGSRRHLPFVLEDGGGLPSQYSPGYV
jgi:hypothetical protein